MRRVGHTSPNWAVTNKVHNSENLYKATTSKMLGAKQFLLLVWKGLLLRKRHFVVTGFELGLPLLIICGCVYLRTILPPANYYSRMRDYRHDLDDWKDATYYPESDPLKGLYSSRYRLYYAPNNSISHQLIERAAKLVGSADTVFELIPTEDERQMELLLYNNSYHSSSSSSSYVYISSYSYRLVGIVFNNLGDSFEATKKLDYKLKLRSDFETGAKYFTSYGGRPTFDDDDSVYREFNAFQEAVAQSFIEAKHPSRSKAVPKVMLQRYPYPEHTESYSMFSIFVILPYFIVYGFLLTCLVFVKRIVDEKTNRAKEMMKMMGLSDFVYWSGTFSNNFVLMGLICAITTILFKIKFVDDSSVLDGTDGFLFFILLLLYSGAMLLFCMAISTFCNKSAVAVILTLILWVVSHTVPSVMLDSFITDRYYEFKLGVKLSACLLPNMALHWGFKIMGLKETTGDSLSWSNMSTPTRRDNLTLSMIMGMLLVNCAISSFFIWYIDNVWPFQYGMPLPFYYIFTPSYWRGKFCRRKYTRSVDEVETKSKYFEKELAVLEKGIVLKHLTKVLGWGGSRKLAVNDVSMNIYSGGVTALLGHNGAGKTTTMNMITGLYPPTQGTAYINGYDIRSETKAARSGLGLCPQHNVLYETLTVEEHLMFFCGLKGFPFKLISQEVSRTLEFLHLVPQKNTLSRNLSGGMKRKLSLGIAMIGGSQVLILDEPTTGLDPQARRSVWDMLNEIKKERTILLTTHYMEEADVLGDRIAIMADGFVQCYGSPLFLKKMFGAGYHLRLVKNDAFKLQGVINVIEKHIPGVQVDSEINTEVTLVLNPNSSELFVGMFDELEGKKQTLGIVSCGLSITTMEDVFLKVGQLAEQGLLENTSKGSTSNGADTAVLIESRTGDNLFMSVPRKLEGMQLQLQILKGLVLKRFHDAKRYRAFLIFQFIVPLLCVFLMVYIVQVSTAAYVNVTTPLRLSVRDVFGRTVGLTTPGINSEASEVMNKYQKVLEMASQTHRSVENITSFILEFGRSNLITYRQDYLVGGDVQSSPSFKATAWYNGEAHHVSAMSINLMDNAILKYVTNSDDAEITVTNSPLSWTPTSFMLDQMELLIITRVIFSVFLPIALTFLSSSYVLFPIHERVTKSKLIQLMTGIYRPVFWIAHFLCDFIIYTICATFLIIPFAALDFYGIYSGGSHVFGAYYFLLLMYGWSAIPFSYLLSFIPKTTSGGFTLVTILNIIAGLICSLVIGGLFFIPTLKEDVKIAIWFVRLLPIFSVTWGACNIHTAAAHNSLCSRKSQRDLEFLCPTVDPNNVLFQCCPARCGNQCFQSRSYLSWDLESSGRDAFFLFLDGVIYFALLMLMETNFVKLWYSVKQSWHARYGKHPEIQEVDLNKVIMEDTDVAAERQRVEELMLRGEMDSEALVVSNLSKSFGNKRAVDRLTFAIHKNECFGLLGVNGAGKTTTFSMLTGDLLIGEGNAYIQSYNAKDHLHMFQTYIGYCPQFDALLDRLSGRESLSLFARLRGIPEEDIQFQVSTLIRMIDLDAHADKISAKYSGGNRRKLSLGLALIGNPSVIFLDEPTAGVDPAARRKIWEALMTAQRSGVMTFVLTTHSMEECEALCSRLGIMVSGQFRCIGANQHLKSKFGEGFTVVIKLAQAQAFDTEAINAVRQFIEKRFPRCELKDIHQGTLTYHLQDRTLAWSELFRAMEIAKQKYCLEDYLVNDTTLEQIFLAFARTQEAVVSV